MIYNYVIKISLHSNINIHLILLICLRKHHIWVSTKNDFNHFVCFQGVGLVGGIHWPNKREVAIPIKHNYKKTTHFSHYWYNCWLRNHIKWKKMFVQKNYEATKIPSSYQIPSILKARFWYVCVNTACAQFIPQRELCFWRRSQKYDVFRNIQSVGNPCWRISYI